MSDSKISPVARLQASRERLRDAMSPPPAPPSVGLRERLRPNSVQRWLRSLRGTPVVGEVAAAVGDWWTAHPFRPVARIAGDLSTVAVSPVAQKHPLALVGTSAAVGAVLLWATPWRWAIRTVLFAGLVPQLASKIVSKLPLQSWLTLLGTAIASRSRAPATAVVVAAPAAPSVHTPRVVRSAPYPATSPPAL